MFQPTGQNLTKRYIIRGARMIQERRLGWINQGAAANILKGPIHRVSITTAQHKRPISITFWTKDEKGIEIRSSMKNIGDRTEIGVLSFNPRDPKIRNDEIFFPAPKSFTGEHEISKLTIRELDAIAESGIAIRSSINSEIFVVAGANPFTLAIKGVSDEPYFFEPEYPLQAYQRETL